MRRVIGIGSPFGADRAAWQVIDRLADRVPTDIQLTALDRPGAALINWLHAEDDVTLIDAAIGCPAGATHLQLDPGDLCRRPNRIDSHSQRLADVLALAEVLGRMPYRLTLYVIHIVADEILTAGGAAPPGVAELTRKLAKDLNAQASRAIAEEPDASRSCA